MLPGSKFFPYRVDPFVKADSVGMQESKQEVIKVISLCAKWWLNLQVYSFTFSNILFMNKIMYQRRLAQSYLSFCLLRIYLGIVASASEKDLNQTAGMHTDLGLNCSYALHGPFSFETDLTSLFMNNTIVDHLLLFSVFFYPSHCGKYYRRCLGRATITECSLPMNQ